MRAVLKFFNIFLLCTLILSCAPSIPEEQGPPLKAYFCPRENCTALLSTALAASKQRDCALYDVNHPSVLQQFKNSRLVIDNDNKITGYAAVYDTKTQYMHDKFCLLDTGVLVGSFNPTSAADRTYNNMVFIPSPSLTSLYSTEFDELFEGTFGRGAKTKHPTVRYNGHLLSAYFCPEDDCEGVVKKQLNEATRSIRFMTFSLTNEKIADILIERYHSGINVTGIVEGQRRNMQYEQGERLAQAGIPVTFESTSLVFHHKVFIIDDRLVITGSANPTSSGYHRNDENILLIEDPAIVQAFITEFNLLNDLMLT